MSSGAARITSVLAPARPSARMPANARVVGASGGQSKNVRTVPSGRTCAFRKNCVWHSGTCSLPACDARSAGSGGTWSEKSRSISRTTSRGAEANSSTISASFGGMSVTVRPYARGSGGGRRRHEGHITEADDADDVAVAVTHEQAADVAFAHRLDRLLDRGRLLHHDQLAGRDGLQRRGGDRTSLRDRP